MELSGKRIAILVENEYQDLEVWYPALRFREAGAEVLFVGTGREQYASKHGYPVRADTSASKVSAREIDATYEDAEVVRDGHLVTSRKPEDLPAFCRAILQALKEGS